MPVVTINVDEHPNRDALGLFIRDIALQNNVPVVFRLPDTLVIAVMVYPNLDAHVMLSSGDWEPYDLDDCVDALWLWKVI